MTEFSRAQRVRLWLSDLLFRWSCRVEPFYDEWLREPVTEPFDEEAMG